MSIKYMYVSRSRWRKHQRRLRGTVGTVPQISKFVLGGRPMHPSPKYFEKYTGLLNAWQSTKWLKKMVSQRKFCSEIEVFVKNMVIYYAIYQISDDRDTQKTHKIGRCPKKSSEIFGVRMDIFPKKSFENLVREIIFPSPKLGAKSPPMGEDIRGVTVCDRGGFNEHAWCHTCFDFNHVYESWNLAFCCDACKPTMQIVDAIIICNMILHGISHLC